MSSSSSWTKFQVNLIDIAHIKTASKAEQSAQQYHANSPNDWMVQLSA